MEPTPLDDLAFQVRHRLIDYLKAEHELYRAAPRHSIQDDLEHICRVTVCVVTALIHACGARMEMPAIA